MNNKHIHSTLVGLLLLATAVPAFAGRILTTPFAETPKPGDFRIFTFGLKESRSTNNWRTLYRLDAGLFNNTEIGVLVIRPQNGPSSTWLNLQYKLVQESRTQPTISIGVWDAANIDGFSGQKAGGSFFVAASKSVSFGNGNPPTKLSIGFGTNRLNGLFGGAIVPLSKQFGIMAEYAPPNLRLPKADGVDISLYYRPVPQVQMRASWVGGNPMFDTFYAWTIGKD